MDKSRNVTAFVKPSICCSNARISFESLSICVCNSFTTTGTDGGTCCPVRAAFSFSLLRALASAESFPAWLAFAGSLNGRERGFIGLSTGAATGLSAVLIMLHLILPPVALVKSNCIPLHPCTTRDGGILLSRFPVLFFW